MKRKIYAAICIVLIGIYHPMTCMSAGDITAVQAEEQIFEDLSLDESDYYDRINNELSLFSYDKEIEGYVDSIVAETDPDLIKMDPQMNEHRLCLYQLREKYPQYAISKLEQLLNEVESESDYDKLLYPERAEENIILDDNLLAVNATDSTKTSTGEVISESQYDKVFQFEVIKGKYNGAMYKGKFENIMSKASRYNYIPGIKQTNISGTICKNMVPQGLCKTENYTLVSAYCYDKTHNSVLYVLDYSGREFICTVNLNLINHAGGIAYDKDLNYVWECDSTNDTMRAYDMQKIADNAAVANRQTNQCLSLNPVATLKVSQAPSFCTYYDGYLWVGTFHKTESKTVTAYKISKSGSTVSLKKCASIDIPAKVQGVSFWKSGNTTYCIISTSWGTEKSHIYSYKIDDYDKVKNAVKLSKTPINDIIFPIRLEELHTSGTTVYAVFESAANHYRSIFYPCIDNICEFTTYYLYK